MMRLFYLALLCLFSLINHPRTLASPENTVGNDLWRFRDLPRGSYVVGMSEIKRYLQRFGYFPPGISSFSDRFDPNLEASIRRYQVRLGLPVTGSLDEPTLSSMVLPRCGVHDHPTASATTTTTLLRRYVYFPGMPRWPPDQTELAYWIASETYPPYLTGIDVEQTVSRAFDKWSAVIRMNFTRVDNREEADIRIGFYGGDHGDGQAFDGVLGVLAHAFAPKNGRLHLDSAETWAIDFKVQTSSVAIDLESVVLHEIGHLLGLGHSSVREAVMYPNVQPRTRKVELTLDDVEGMQSLYGSNPNFDPGSIQAVDQQVHSSFPSRPNRMGFRSRAWFVFLLIFLFQQLS